MDYQIKRLRRSGIFRISPHSESRSAGGLILVGQSNYRDRRFFGFGFVLPDFGRAEAKPYDFLAPVFTFLTLPLIERLRCISAGLSLFELDEALFLPPRNSPRDCAGRRGPFDGCREFAIRNVSSSAIARWNEWLRSIGIFLPISFSISRKFGTSSQSQNEILSPVSPARAVRPMRCTYPSGSTGIS